MNDLHINFLYNLYKKLYDYILYYEIKQVIETLVKENIIKDIPYRVVLHGSLPGIQIHGDTSTHYIYRELKVQYSSDNLIETIGNDTEWSEFLYDLRLSPVKSKYVWERDNPPTLE